MERVGGLEAEAEWSHVLSLGEQQRVAFLRLLLHSPRAAFLDEATGALDSATEAALYTRLRAYCTSYISVGACSQQQLACRAPLLPCSVHLLHICGCVFAAPSACSPSCCSTALCTRMFIRHPVMQASGAC